MNALCFWLGGVTATAMYLLIEWIQGARHRWGWLKQYHPFRFGIATFLGLTFWPGLFLYTVIRTSDDSDREDETEDDEDP